MKIDITLDPEKADGDFEFCVFCKCPTVYINKESQRPVCPFCSVQHSQSDILNAPHNY